MDRADYDGNAYFVGEMLSAFVPSPTAIAKQGTVAWKLYNKFDDSGKCASMITKLVHGGCFVAGTKVTVSDLPYSSERETALWSETDWLDSALSSFPPSPLSGNAVKHFSPMFSLPLGSSQRGANWQLQTTHERPGSPPVSYRWKQRFAQPNAASTE